MEKEGGKVFIEDDDEFDNYLEKKSVEFEEKLKSDKKDPLERAKSRRIFYKKQREESEARQRTINLLFKVKNKNVKRTRKIEDRVFEALGNEVYKGTIISKELVYESKVLKKLSEEPRLNNEHPVYCGEDGKLYDINYMPLKSPIVPYQRGKFSSLQFTNVTRRGSLKKKKFKNPDDQEIYDNRSKFEFCHDPELYENPPIPDSFSSFDDFEDALEEWALDVQRSLGYLQLPHIFGRHYYRPVVNEENSEGGENTPTSQDINTQQNYSIEDEIEGIQNIEDKSENLEEFYHRSQETWETDLVPMQPKPEFYDDFADYENAMVRWSVICFGIPFIPPHPAQFQKLVGVTISQYPTYMIEDVEVQQNVETESEKIFSENLVKKKKIKKSEEIIISKLGNEWDNLQSIYKKRIIRKSESLLEEKSKALKEFGCYHKLHIPIIKGQYSQKDKLMRRVSLADLTSGPGAGSKNSNVDSVKGWISEQRRSKSLSAVFAQNTMPYYQAIAENLKHQVALRREDLPNEIKKLSYDCNEVENEKQVVFKVPEFDVGQIDFERLKNVHYIRFLGILLIRFDNGTRYDKLNSFYYPKENPSVTKNYSKELSAILDEIEHPSQIDFKTLSKVFLTEAYLDIFQKWFNSNLPKNIEITIQGKNEELRTYLDLLFASCNQANFCGILSLLKFSNSLLVHAKVSEFVLKFLKTKLAQLNIEELIKQKDIITLKYVTQAVTFYDEVPVKLFVYDNTTKVSLTQSHGQSNEEFISNLLCIYYLDCICVSLLEEDREFPYLYPMLIETIEKLIRGIEQKLSKEPTFLLFIWKLIGSRSQKLSELGEFTLSFLFFMSHIKEIELSLAHPNFGLLKYIRKYAGSKLSHVQVAIANLFPKLKEKKWERLLSQTYSKANNLLQDLITSATSVSLNSQAPLISSMVLDFLNDTLVVKRVPDKYSDTIVKGLIKTQAFGKILQEVLASFHEKRMGQSTLLGSIFLANFSKFVLTQNLITLKVEKSTNKGGFNFSFFGTKKAPNNETDTKNSNNLEVSISNVLSIVHFVCNTHARNKYERKTYKPRLYMLSCLRHLLKVGKIFRALTKRDKNFFQNLASICKDGVDMEFNKGAWQLFYQLIKYHTGVIEMLKNDGKLEVFINLISSENSVVMKNSMEYFSKIFRLPVNSEGEGSDDDDVDEEDEEKTDSKFGGNLPTDEVVKNYDKSIQILVQFIISKNLFGVFHKAYTTLSVSHNGWPFQAMVSLYETILNHTSCSKLLVALKKVKEYKDALTHVSSMLSGVKDSFS